MAFKSQGSALGESSLPGYTLFATGPGSEKLGRREEVSQLLTEMGMGGRRNEIRGQRAQGLQRSSRKEPGPTKVEKRDKADKFRGVWMVPWPENLVLVGRPHLKMESEAAPLPVSCQGWTRQGLVGKDWSLPTGLPSLPFPLLSLLLLQPRRLRTWPRERALCLHVPVGD